MSKNIVRVFLILPLVLLLVGMQSQSAFAKGKQTAASKSAEDKCVRNSGTCLKNCEGKIIQKSCENACGDKLNMCLNNVKTVSANPTTETQKVKQNPAAAGQQMTSNKGGVDKQGMQKSGNKK